MNVMREYVFFWRTEDGKRHDELILAENREQAIADGKKIMNYSGTVKLYGKPVKIVGCKLRETVERNSICGSYK